MSDAEAWRHEARRRILEGDVFYSDDKGLLWLDVERCHDVDLLPLASLAECGHKECACTRSLNPWIRHQFREELVDRALAAQRSGSISADGRINYVGVGSGLLLGDLDVIAGLQEAGFAIAHATFIDPDYRTNCQGALAEMASYLAPAEMASCCSAAEYAFSRLHGELPAADLFVQIDVSELGLDEAAVLSVLALGDAGGGLAFRLENRYHSSLVPMLSWCRRPTPGRVPGQAGLTALLLERVVASDACSDMNRAAHASSLSDSTARSACTEGRTEAVACAAHGAQQEARHGAQQIQMSHQTSHSQREDEARVAYARILNLVNPRSLIDVNKTPVQRNR